MLIFLSASPVAFASEDALISDSDVDLDMLLFLGETAGLESLGVDLDGLLGLEALPDTKYVQEGDKHES